MTFSGVIYFFLGALVLFKLELVVHLPPNYLQTSDRTLRGKGSEKTLGGKGE